jgi:hypothetical protein
MRPLRQITARLLIGQDDRGELQSEDGDGIAGDIGRHAEDAKDTLSGISDAVETGLRAIGSTNQAMQSCGAVELEAESLQLEQRVIPGHLIGNGLAGKQPAVAGSLERLIWNDCHGEHDIMSCRVGPELDVLDDVG